MRSWAKKAAALSIHTFIISNSISVTSLWKASDYYSSQPQSEIRKKIFSSVARNVHGIVLKHFHLFQTVKPLSYTQ